MTETLTLAQSGKPQAELKQDPYAKIRPIAEKFEILPFGAIKPGGWIKQQIEANLEGFTGHLDSLAPDLIVSDDIYVKDRLSKTVKNKEVGALAHGDDVQAQFLWWNSETQSNWRDGYIRSAILAQDQTHLKRIQKYVDRIIESQDADGYLGIYDPELRYNFDNENGELWSQATLLRGLLAWYGYTRNPKVLEAIKRSAANTMKGFPADASHPFYSVNPNVGGLSHGLAYTDVMEELYRITRNRQYLDYALFLYRDFSSQILNEDAQYAKLLQKDLALKGHGVHTYEHLRSVAAAVYASGNPALKTALKNFLAKISNTTTPSGGPVGDEWIAGGKADATKRGYEYCSLQELLHSYESLYAKTGKANFGDKIENLFFNAAQGSRHPSQSCIAYLKSDNSYEMTGGLTGDKSDPKQTRYRYSPVHREAAVCCVPNAGRIAPYYVSGMWLKDGDSLVASLLGPSEVKTTINRKLAMISETTNYPYENKIVFKVEYSGSFAVKIRKPEWASKFSLDVPFTEAKGFIIVEADWSKSPQFTLEFFPEVVTRQDANGEYYFTFGALVLAHQIEATAETTKQYSLAGFSDSNYRPEDLVIYRYNESEVKPLGNNKFATLLIDPKTQKRQNVVLEPMGGTILRQVTFKKP